MLECSQALGYQDENISVGDLKLLLMAVFQIKGNKRLGVSREIEDHISQATVDMKLKYGWFNKEC